MSGGKAPSLTDKTELNPPSVVEALGVYSTTIDGWNVWLNKNGHTEVAYKGPVGSSFYAHQDNDEQAEVVYGDIDVVLEIPVAEGQTNLEAQKVYKALWVEYLETTNPPTIHVDATLDKGAFTQKRYTQPFQFVLRLPNDRYVQADSIITFPKVSPWTSRRFVPQRDFKGYVHGNIYDAIGNVLQISMNKSGVFAKFIDGIQVSPLKRKDTIVKVISNDLGNVFADIARFYGAQVPATKGVPEDSHSKELYYYLAKGSKELFQALEAVGHPPAEERMNKVLSIISTKNDKETERRGKTPELADKFAKMGKTAFDIVSGVYLGKLQENKKITTTRSRLVQIIREEVERELSIGRKVGVFAGGFRPPHKGHLFMVEQALRQVEKVIILISRKDREGYSGQTSLDLWKHYIQTSGLTGKVEVFISSSPSPVAASYDILEDKNAEWKATEGDIILPMVSQKDSGKRFANFQTYKNTLPHLRGGETLHLPSLGDMGATGFRAALATGENIEKFIPEAADFDTVMTIIAAN